MRKGKYRVSLFFNKDILKFFFIRYNYKFWINSFYSMRISRFTDSSKLKMQK